MNPPKRTLFLFAFTIFINIVYGQWPMSNDTGFNSDVAEPTYARGEGPKILLDGAHHNFFIQWDFFVPFSDLATADGYQTIVDSLNFTPDYLERFDIVMIITALPFDFTTKNEVTDESTFSEEELNSLYDWVNKGGSLLVFSEHAPFDQAINPLLNKFGITSSVGTTIDTTFYDKDIGRTGWIEFSRKNGLLNGEHPITQGRNPSARIKRLLTFGGSGLSGEGYSNILKLSESSENVMHSTGVGPVGKGNSQGLAGTVGKGKVVAFGDSNGFTAMVFDLGDGIKQAAGMNLKGYDWKQFVLNTLYWLSEK
ncbi:hypothetical protein [Lentiprolixibacter aurantiacus]|uniref:DUF4350 domain-containing protein n=1 Tax=Lentiprolixibacter aurantiacus TaxID=2993939 RepID=A0AAE3MKM3_9FLAO|nr:hypothetical protein [Lentiprolixibacter aurantiacus]MCX2719178.1 hypothetical protein [Lentiprolixibacter aurantiacus]